MLKITLLVTFCVLIFVSNNFAQECGIGYFQITFNIKDSVKYQLFPILPKGEDYSQEDVKTKLRETFFPKLAVTEWFWAKTQKVEKSVAEKFLKSYKLENFDSRYDKTQMSGKSVNGEIRLKTFEVFFTPFLMKISTKKFKTAYYIGNFKGGCHTDKLISLEPK